VRLVCLILAFSLSLPAVAQDAPRKKKKQLAHKKPTAEQIRKFNELQKKR
jgi:hypothetical protein